MKNDTTPFVLASIHLFYQKIARLLRIATARTIGMTGKIYFTLSRGPTCQRTIDAIIATISPSKLMMKAATQIIIKSCIILFLKKIN
jgi:hypothetical protein